VRASFPCGPVLTCSVRAGAYSEGSFLFFFLFFSQAFFDPPLPPALPLERGPCRLSPPGPLFFFFVDTPCSPKISFMLLPFLFPFWVPSRTPFESCELLDTIHAHRRVYSPELRPLFIVRWKAPNRCSPLSQIRCSFFFRASSFRRYSPRFFFSPGTVPLPVLADTDTFLPQYWRLLSIFLVAHPFFFSLRAGSCYSRLFIFLPHLDIFFCPPARLPGSRDHQFLSRWV